MNDYSKPITCGIAALVLASDCYFSNAQPVEHYESESTYSVPVDYYSLSLDSALVGGICQVAASAWAVETVRWTNLSNRDQITLIYEV